MTEHTPEQCAKRIFQGFSDWPCSREGKLFEEGKWWCKQHAPSARKKRDDARDARWAEERAIREQKNVRNQKERLAYEHTYAKGINPEAVQDMREALQECLDHMMGKGILKEGHDERVEEQARAALSKAKKPGP